MPERDIAAGTCRCVASAHMLAYGGGSVDGKPMTILPRPVYWVLALALLGFGFLAMFSIGAPFFALGLALVVLAPFRQRPAIFWPAIGGVLAFFVGYVLVAPLGCTAQATMREAAGTSGGGGSEIAGATVCASLLGIDYSGAGTYNPPLWPALIAGLATAAAIAVVIRVLVARATAAGVTQPN